MMAIGVPFVITGLTGKRVTWPANRWDIDGPIKYWITSSKIAYSCLLTTITRRNLSVVRAIHTLLA